MALQRVCDIHDGEHEGAERTITVDGKKILIDACDGFVTDLRNRGRLPEIASPSLNGQVKPKAAVAAKKSVPSRRASKPLARRSLADKAKATTQPANSEKFPCPFCPEELVSTSAQGHIQRRHGFATARDGYGEKCPLDGLKHGRLTNHAKEEHGLVNAGLLFKAAAEAGDPHGIVAARRKVAKNVS